MPLQKRERVRARPFQTRQIRRPWESCDPGVKATGPSEDDIARQKMGARGRPGEDPIANELRESETQLPKPLDPGHTA